MAAETKVLISGDPSGAVKAFADVKKAAGDFSAFTDSAIKPLSSSLDLFKRSIAAVGAVLAGGKLFKDSIAAANEWNSQVAGLAKSLGTTTEKASVMAVALNHLGIESDLLVRATSKISERLANNEQAFKSLGVQTRDITSGALLPAGEILANVSTRLGEMTNATQQNIRGVTIFGESWNELRGILKLTSAEIATAEDRAKRLGLVIGSDAAAQTKQYKEAQRDLALVGKALEVQIGERLLPVLVKLGSFFSVFGNQYGKHITMALEGVSFAMRATALFASDLGDAIAAFGAQVKAVFSWDRQAFKAIGDARDEQFAKNDALLKKMADEIGKPLIAEENIAEKRKRLQKELQTALGNLEHLRAVEAGKASATIADNDAKLLQERLNNAEKLRDALRSAWQESIASARQAADESKKLFEQAAATRQSGKDRAAELRRGDLSPEDKAFIDTREARNAADEATSASLQAKMAAYSGRAEAAKKLADQASKAAESALKISEKLADPGEQAKLIERASEAQAAADEARALIKKQQANDIDETAKKQADMINELDTQVEVLRKKIENMSLTINISEAIASINQILVDLDKIQDKTVTVTVNEVRTGTTGDFSSGASGSYWSGGFTGRGGKFDPAGIVHRGEFVSRSEVVRQPGALRFLEMFNAIGMKALPGYANGGLVSQIRVGSVSSAPERASAVFNFPDLGQPFPVSMAVSDRDRLEQQFARAALKMGGRR